MKRVLSSTVAAAVAGYSWPQQLTFCDSLFLVLVSRLVEDDWCCCIMVLGSCVDTTVAPHNQAHLCHCIAPAQADQITWRPAWVGKSHKSTILAMLSNPKIYSEYNPPVNDMDNQKGSEDKKTKIEYLDFKPSKKQNND